MLPRTLLRADSFRRTSQACTRTSSHHSRRSSGCHTACRRHSFRVRARTRVGAGAFSDETEPLECALSAPAAPTVRALGSSVAELEWEAPDGHGVSELQYVVQVASQAAGAAGDGTPLAEWRDVEHSVVGTAAAERRVVANVRGLRASVVAAYRFRVCAMNNAQCGRGDFSAPSEPLCLPPALPSPPLDVRAEAGRPAHDGPAHVVRIDWKAPADDGGMEIVGYALQSRCEWSAVMWYPVQSTSPSALLVSVSLLVGSVPCHSVRSARYRRMVPWQHTRRMGR